MSLKKLLPDAVLVVVLLVVPLGFFAQQTLGGRTMLPVDNLYQFEPYASMAGEVGVDLPPHNALISDLILQNAAWKQFAVEQVQQGEIPLWQSNIAGGGPFLGAGQSSALYPFTLLFLLMPIPAAFGWFTVSQLWLAGVFMLLLARVLGLERGPALISALIYQIGGFTLVSVVFPMIIATMVWLPFLLAMLELTIRQAPALGGQPATLPWVALGAMGLGMAALAGHAEALYFTLLVMAFYAAWRLLAEVIARRADLRAAALRGVWLLGLVGAGLALGAVQLAPTAELVTRGFREGRTTLAEVREFGYPTRRVLAFVMPNFFGSPAHHAYLDVFTGERVALTENAFGDPVRSTEWGIKNYVEGGAYVGILPLVLVGIAGIAAVVRPEPGSPGPLFAVLGVLSLSFVFGTPTYALLYYGLPFINQSHSPFRWVWPLTLCLAVLAGIGAQALNRLPPKTIRWLAALCLAAGALVIGGVVVSRIAYPADLVQRTFEGLALAANAFPDGRAFYSYQVRNAAILAVMLLGSGGVLLLAAARITVREVPAWWIAAPALLIVDMALAYGGLYPANDPALLDVQPESIAWLADHYDPLDPWRYIAYEEPGADTINSNIGWLHGLEDAAGYDSLLLGSYADFMRVIQPQGDLLYNRIAPLYTAHPDSLVSPALDLLGVRYVITETTIDLPTYNPVYSDEAVTIYENVDAYPRAFTVPQSATVFYEGDIQEAARSYDVRTTVLIKVFPPAVHTPPEDFRGEATLTVNTPADTWIDVNVSDPAWLIVTENAYPGWRAFVRPLGAGDAAEVEAKVVQVNGTFQGVRLAEGRWTVRLSYSPNSVWLGGFVSFMAGIGLVFALGVYAWRYFYRESEEGSAARRVAKNAITPIVLNLFNRGIQFAFAIVYLRLLGPVGAGQYTYAVLIFGWFDILSNFGLDTLLMREVARDKEAANRWLVNTTIIRLAIAVLGIPLLVAFIAARNALGDSPLPAVTVTAIWLLYIGLFISTVNKGLTGLFYAYEKAEYPAATQTISTMLVASLGMIALLLGTGIVGLAAVSIIVNAITLALLGWLTLQQFFVPRPTFDWQLQRSAMGESFPLMINHLLATLFFRIDVILLELLTTAQVVGWYGVVYKWIDAINVIPAFFTQALFPVMSRQAAEDRALLKRSYVFSVKLLTLLSLPTAVITTLLAPLLIGILAGAAFLPYSAIALQIFVWSIPLGWINSVTNYVIIALDRQRILTWAFVFGAGFNVAGNLILIPRYNFPAAAAMTILSEFVLLAFFYMVLLAPLGRINWVGALWRIAVPAGAMGAAAWLLAPLNVWVALGTSLVVYAALIWILRPFTPFEQQQLTDLLPERLRRTVSC